MRNTRQSFWLHSIHETPADYADLKYRLLWALGSIIFLFPWIPLSGDIDFSSLLDVANECGYDWFDILLYLMSPPNLGVQENPKYSSSEMFPLCALAPTIKQNALQKQ